MKRSLSRTPFVQHMADSEDPSSKTMRAPMPSTMTTLRLGSALVKWYSAAACWKGPASLKLVFMPRFMVEQPSTVKVLMAVNAGSGAASMMKQGGQMTVIPPQGVPVMFSETGATSRSTVTQPAPDAGFECELTWTKVSSLRVAAVAPGRSRVGTVAPPVSGSEARGDVLLTLLRRAATSSCICLRAPACSSNSRRRRAPDPRNKAAAIQGSTRKSGNRLPEQLHMLPCLGRVAAAGRAAETSEL
mmetsp:Transcript_761/g.2567  ORF Transcript_761/g.2567 Transcript_761/m.2567 type:complete len:245 (-) Transcript_761:78-812(-)